jgi:phosphatidylinositol alpha-1,6-mannosyltransferase
MPSLLVTNDFPPKLGGIQSYLFELWRRLPPGETTVLTTAHAGAREWDARQPFRVVRARQRVLLPTRALTRDVDALAREVGADVIFLDPMLPLGSIGPRLRSAPYVVVAHGAEITVPASIPGLRARGARILRGAAAVVAAGGYPARQAARVAGTDLRGVVVPPGVDAHRFHPLRADERLTIRAHFGLDPARPLVLGLSRLVPRKGFDVVVDAVAGMPGVQLAIGGAGRDRARLERRARGNRTNVHFLGRVPDAELPRLYGSADAFAMCCRDRWGGIEAEGFGIVFLEAAARYRPWPGVAVVLTKPSSTRRPGTSSNHETSVPSGRRSPRCATTRSCVRAWAGPRGSAQSARTPTMDSSPVCRRSPGATSPSPRRSLGDDSSVAIRADLGTGRPVD